MKKVYWESRTPYQILAGGLHIGNITWDPEALFDLSTGNWHFGFVDPGPWDVKVYWLPTVERKTAAGRTTQEPDRSCDLQAQRSRPYVIQEKDFRRVFPYNNNWTYYKGDALPHSQRA